MIKVRVVRDIGDSDLAEVRSLLDAVESADDHPALGEHKWLDLVGSGLRHDYAGIIAEEPPHPHPVGYAHLSANPPVPDAPEEPPNPQGATWGLELAVHPEHRGIGVEVALAETALAVATAEGGGRLHWWVQHPSEIHDALAHRLGLGLGRELFQMRRSLPHPEVPRWPTGVKVRPFVAGADEDDWLAVNNRAFAGHPEQGDWDRDVLLAREAEPWFDPSGFLLAEDHNGLAGFCWTKIHHQGDEPSGGHDHRLGEIYVIAADPSRHGQGLGKALVLGGLASLTERGVSTAMLYVDAANSPAVGLYRALGFGVHHVDRAYVIDLPASS